MFKKFNKWKSDLSKSAVGAALLTLIIPLLLIPALPQTITNPNPSVVEAETEPPSGKTIQETLPRTGTPTPAMANIVANPTAVAIRVAATPLPTPLPTTTPKSLTWQDNPNNCNTELQWITASPPFTCIDKPVKKVISGVAKVVPKLGQVVSDVVYSGVIGLSGVLNSPYVAGGTTPAGFDCSGLTQYLSKLRGISVPRSSSGQISSLRHIPMSEARTGDIVGFNYGHVGIYLGGNKVVHALNPAQGVQINNLDEAIKYNGFLSFLAVGH